MSLRLCLVASLVVAGCQAAAPLEPALAAGSFIQALNAKNVERMNGLSAAPFRYRNQAWESAADGSGLVLGKAEDRVAKGPEELRALLQDVIARVQVEDPSPVQNAPPKPELLNGPLRGAPPAWGEMNLVLFRRGEGDVEHVAIVGVDAAGKVTGLYVN